MTILVTGGAGFIGTNFVTEWLSQSTELVVNLDKLTYAGNRANLSQLNDNKSHVFVRGDIADQSLVTQLLSHYNPRAVINLAAESHVDHSIHAPEDFVQTNVVGTFRLLEAVRNYWRSLPQANKEAFRFLHISTDEVYGSLGIDEPAFSEISRYAPNNPYSASKAASDHFIRAYYHTYGLPVLTMHCSNGYGPYQFPEKLIPLSIHNALAGKPLLIYGDGQQIRDWLYVADHCSAIRRVLKAGTPGDEYNIGGASKKFSEKTNIEVVQLICLLLEEILPKNHYPKMKGTPKTFQSLITYAADRPGHDRRYATNTEKIERELGWKPQENFETGLRKTVQWYVDHQK